MSEITTGAVSLSLIGGAPLLIGAAVIGAAYFACKYAVKNFEEVKRDIDNSNKALQWNDNTITSPKKMAKKARRIKKTVTEHPSFIKSTKGLSDDQKDILAGAIATENSPLKSYVPELLQDVPESSNAFETALNRGVKNLALDNFKFVNDVVKDAAKATGFVGEVKILKNAESVSDIVFTDKLNRRFTAYCKLDKEMNPSLALDLEGFGCDTNECTLKMDEIIKYLKEHGVPFKHKRIKHNQPMGVLRNILKRKEKEQNRNTELSNYLQGGNSNFKSKQKLS